MANRVNHLSMEMLADLSEDRLRAEERAASLEHLSACLNCRDALARLDHVTGLMRTDRMEEVPPELLARAVSLFRGRAAAARMSPSLAQRVLAALSFDSRQLSPAFGFRAAGAAASRQMLFSAGETDIDLRLQSASGETWVVAGQVLGPCQGGRVEMVGEEHTASVSLNELGEFTLPPAPPGAYLLRVSVGDLVIEIPSLQLGS